VNEREREERERERREGRRDAVKCWREGCDEKLRLARGTHTPTDMGAAGTLLALSAGVVLGVFISQQYAVPDVKQGVDWLGQQVKKVDKVYKKKND